MRRNSKYLKTNFALTCTLKEKVILKRNSLTLPNLIEPLHPKISLVNLLIVCHTILTIFVPKIWYWINS